MFLGKSHVSRGRQDAMLKARNDLQHAITEVPRVPGWWQAMELVQKSREL